MLLTPHRVSLTIALGLLTALAANAQPSSSISVNSPNGAIWVTVETSAPGVPTYAVRYRGTEVLRPSKIGLQLAAAAGEDLAYVTARVEDKDGTLCPEATNQLKMAVSGAGKFRAVGNGDATSLELFHEPQMHAFHGQLVAIVQATDKAGNVQLKVTGKGLKAGVLDLKTAAAPAK